MGETSVHSWTTMTSSPCSECCEPITPRARPLMRRTRTGLPGTLAPVPGPGTPPGPSGRSHEPRRGLPGCAGERAQAALPVSDCPLSMTPTGLTSMLSAPSSASVTVAAERAVTRSRASTASPAPFIAPVTPQP